MESCLNKILNSVNKTQVNCNPIFQVNYTHGDDARVRLLQDEEERVGMRDTGSIPSYVGQSEALQYQMTRLESKVGQLDALHKKHLARPSFDDASSEETEIKVLTKEISEVNENVVCLDF